MDYQTAVVFLGFSFFFMMVMLLQYTKPGPRRRNNMMFLTLIVFMNILMWELYQRHNDVSSIPWPYWILYATMLSYFIQFACLV